MGIRHQFTVKLFNGEEAPEQGTGIVATVLAAVEGPNAEAWAKEMGTIGGSAWESEGSDFVCATILNTPGLAARLMAEGYLLDSSEYVEAE
jgi:hypothetical protein